MSSKDVDPFAGGERLRGSPDTISIDVMFCTELTRRIVRMHRLNYRLRKPGMPAASLQANGPTGILPIDPVQLLSGPQTMYNGYKPVLC